MSVAMRSSAPGRMMRASSPSVAADTSRRLWWRVFGQGSGNRMNARADAGRRAASAGAGGRRRHAGGCWRAAPRSMALSDLDDAVLERLAADQADVRIVPRLPEQMLAAAEADLEPDLRDGRREQLAEAGRRQAATGRARRAAARAASSAACRGARLAPAPAAVAAQVVLVDRGPWRQSAHVRRHRRLRASGSATRAPYRSLLALGARIVGRLAAQTFLQRLLQRDGPVDASSAGRAKASSASSCSDFMLSRDNRCSACQVSASNSMSLRLCVEPASAWRSDPFPASVTRRRKGSDPVSRLTPSPI